MVRFLRIDPMISGSSHTSAKLSLRMRRVCSDSAFYPHKSPSMPPLPPCLTIQFYSSNQLLFPVIIPISSSSIHLLASFTINLPLLFLFDEFGNFSSFLFAYINTYFISISQSVSQSFKHNSANRRFSDSVFSAR